MLRWAYHREALRRAAIVLALSCGLAAGRPAAAAPLSAAAARPPDNPFDDRAADKSDDAASAGAASEASAPDNATSEAPASGADDTADDDAEGEDEEPESALHGLACLEGDATGGRRKGVQQRDFLKRHKLELSGLGGFYASDALSSTYSYGGAAAFFPSEDFGVELLITRTPVQFRLEQPFNAFDRETHFQSGVAWQGMGSLLWSPIHAKLKLTESTIVHGDLFAVAGAGRTASPTVLGMTWEAGVGFKLYLTRFVAFRLDVRDFLVPQEVLGRDRITNNVTILGGLSFWLG